MTDILELENWHRVSSFMSEKFEAARKAGENAKKRDWEYFKNSDFIKSLTDDSDDMGIFQSGWNMYDARHNKRIDDMDPKDALKLENDNGAYWEEIMNAQWKRITDLWDNDWKNYINTPETMHDKAKLWKKVAEDTKEINQQVSQMAVLQGWQGKGASAYQAMIPKQVEAVDGTSELVGVSGNILDNGAVGMQTFYLTIAQACVDMQMKINQVQSTAMWYSMASAKNIYESFADWLENTVVKKQTNWWDAIKKAQDTVEKHKDIDQKVFKNGHWPESTADGDLADAQPGPASQTPGPTPAVPTPDLPDPDDPANTPPTVDQNQVDPDVVETTEISED